MAPGTVILQGSVDRNWMRAAELGMQLCASGIGVPIADPATGYPVKALKCVASADLNVSQQGQPCEACAWADFGAYGSWEWLFERCKIQRSALYAAPSLTRPLSAQRQRFLCTAVAASCVLL